MGHPFRSRIKDKDRPDGLSYPKGLLPFLFICEACVVRAHLRTELRPTPLHTRLLMFERMRLIDMAHNWAESTLIGISGSLRQFHAFLSLYGLPNPLLPVAPPHPPVHASIPLYWNMSRHTLQKTVHRKVTGFVSYNSSRASRSALQAFTAWTEAWSNPATTVRDRNNRILQVNRVAPSDSILATMTNTGMKRRLGTRVTPSLSLLRRHILWNQASREASFRRASKEGRHAAARIIALAQLTELIAWMAWLRAGELFAITWSKIQAFPPGHGGVHDLPTEVGCLLFTLLDQTKSSQEVTADVVLAWRTSAGLQPGRWYQRCLDLRPPGPSDTIFETASGVPWTSETFRRDHLLPLLRQQRLEGDPYLTPYNGSTPETELAYVFYSIHSYKNGGQSDASLKRPGSIRKASTDERNEHGRWRTKNSPGAEPIVVHYTQWTIRDRINCTLLAM